MSADTPAAALAAASDVVVALDENGAVAFANPAVDRVLGYDPDSIVGDDALAYVPDADRDAVGTAFHDVVEAPPERTERVDHRCHTADGGTVWLESAFAMPATDDLAGPVVTAREISARKRTERKRREATERFRQLADNAGDVLLAFDAGFSTLQFANDAFAEVWGTSLDDLAADPTALVDGAHPDDRASLLDALDDLVAGESIDTEFRVNPGEEYGRWVRLQGTPIESGDETVRLVAVAHDVTRRHERERQVRAMDSVLRHNLRNDLNVVVGHVEQLGQQLELDRESATHLRHVVEHCESLLTTADKARHIVDLLGPGEATTRIDVAEVARRTASAADDAAPRASVEIDVPESAVAECVPKAPLAVTELLDNALTHAEDDSLTVTVTVERRAESVELSVVDDGPPIPEVDRGAVGGERDVTQIDHGSGLGLWLVAWIARCSEGSVRFDVDESGNEVTVRFPRAE